MRAKGRVLSLGVPRGSKRFVERAGGRGAKLRCIACLGAKPCSSLPWSPDPRAARALLVDGVELVVLDPRDQLPMCRKHRPRELGPVRTVPTLVPGTQTVRDTACVGRGLAGGGYGQALPQGVCMQSAT